jgi:inosine-uridine nucleoside N-ribohydrolase
LNDDQQPILLDVDTGVDDALALGLGVFWPADIVTVSTLAGNVQASRSTANTLAVLDLLGANEVPVCRGASRPLVKPPVYAPHVHGEKGLGTAELPASTRSEMREKGPASIVRNARERKGELTLVCVGPLTNLAIALNVEPDLAKWMRKLVIMGGAYTVPGNITPHAEFNIYVDPDAAEQVLSAGFDDITLVGLDVSHQCVLPRSAWETAQKLTSPTAVLVAEVCKEAFAEKGREGVYLHDPLALAIALDPSLAESENVTVTVTTDGEERGRTVTKPGGPHKVARSVNVEQFLARLSESYGLPLESMMHTADNAL